MASEAQVAANRRNAQSSRGPRTDEGKGRSRMNALTHGLTGENAVPVLPTEDPEEHARFREALLVDLAPVGAIEEQLTEEIIEDSWRLRRVANIELGALLLGVAAADERFLISCRRRFEVTNADVTAYALEQAGVGHPETVVEVTNQELHEDINDLIDEVVDVRRTGEARLAQGFIDSQAGSSALANLSRYETAIFRRRNQALATLHSLQAARLAKAEEEE